MMKLLAVFGLCLTLSVQVLAQGHVVINGVQPDVTIGLGNENGNALSVDLATRSLIVIDYAHHEIHSGSHYTCTYTNTLGAGAATNILVTVANSTKWPHMLFDISGDLDTSVIIYEGATNTAGAALSCVNNNRNSTNTALTSINSAAGAVNGTVIYTSRFGLDSGSGPSRVAASGAAREDSEFILKQNTKYLVNITSISAANKINASFAWYEHTSKTD